MHVHVQNTCCITQSNSNVRTFGVYNLYWWLKRWNLSKLIILVVAFASCSVLARGSCDIFPTQRLAFDRSSGDIVLPQRLVLARGPMISSSSLFFVLRVSSDDRSFNINFLSLLEVFRSTFSSSFILT